MKKNEGEKPLRRYRVLKRGFKKKHGGLGQKKFGKKLGGKQVRPFRQKRQQNCRDGSQTTAGPWKKKKGGGRCPAGGSGVKVATNRFMSLGWEKKKGLKKVKK